MKLRTRDLSDFEFNAIVPLVCACKVYLLFVLYLFYLFFVFTDQLGYIPFDVFKSVLLVTIVAHNTEKIDVQLFSTKDPLIVLEQLLKEILDDCESGKIEVRDE